MLSLLKNLYWCKKFACYMCLLGSCFSGLSFIMYQLSNIGEEVFLNGLVGAVAVIFLISSILTFIEQHLIREMLDDGCVTSTAVSRIDLMNIIDSVALCGIIISEIIIAIGSHSKGTSISLNSAALPIMMFVSMLNCYFTITWKRFTKKIETK